jgi:hypothetical protein
MQAAKPPALIKFEMPEVSLSIADIIGRAARFGRENWRLSIRLFAIPELINVVCWEALMMVAQYLWVPVNSYALRALMIIACFLAIGISVLLIRSAFYAQWLLLTGKATSVEQAIATARTYKLFLAYWPTFIVNFIEAAWSTFLIILGAEIMAETVHETERILGVTGMYVALVVMWYLPFRITTLYNMMFAYDFLINEPTYRKGLGRFLFTCSGLPLQVFCSIFLLALTLNLLDIPVLGTSVIENIVEATTKIDREIIQQVGIVPRMMLEATIGLIGSSIAAPTILLLNNEWRIRLEGKDVTDALTKLESR